MHENKFTESGGTDNFPEESTENPAEYSPEESFEDSSEEASETVESSSDADFGNDAEFNIQSGNGDDDLSAEDGGETAESDSTGTDGVTDHPGVDNGSGSPVYDYHTEAATDYTDSFLSLQASVDTLNSTLFLVMVFLLLSWTEKKVSLSVRKFTGERRK